MNIEVLRGVCYELIEVKLDKVKPKNNIGFIICHDFASLNMQNFTSLILVPEKSERKYLNPVRFAPKEFKKDWYQKTKFLKRYGTVYFDEWNIEMDFNEIKFTVSGRRNSTKVKIRYEIKREKSAEPIINKITSQIGAIENSIAKGI